MDWFQSKTTQLIALVSIVGTLAGFGYTGATYVNRLENLEAKIGGIVETEDAQQAIEERFAGSLGAARVGTELARAPHEH